jgi:hypothetical protein
MLKDPDATLDFAVDWSDWLTGEGDTGASAVWIVPTGLTKVSESFVSGKHVVRLSGGTDGSDYSVTSRITTTGGEVDNRTLRITVRQR